MAGGNGRRQAGRVKYGGAQGAGSELALALDRALARGLTEVEIMELVTDRAGNLSENEAADRVFVELPPGLIDLPAAAAKYGLNRYTLHDWVSNQRLRNCGRLRGSARGGGYILLDEAELRAYIAAPRNRGCLLYTSPSPRDS